MAEPLNSLGATSQGESPVSVNARIGRGRVLPVAWGVAAALSLIAAAWWLRGADVRYVIVGALATTATLFLLRALPRRGRGWPIACAVLLAALWISSGVAQRDLHRIESDWPAYRDRLVARGDAAIASALDSAAVELKETATRAANLEGSRESAFDELEELRAHAEIGIVLIRDESPWAWAGRWVTEVPGQSNGGTPGAAEPGVPADGSIRAVFTPFYVTLEATAWRGSQRATASLIVDASPPATRLTSALLERIAERYGLDDIRVLPVAADSGMRTLVVRGDTLLAYRAVTAGPAAARLYLLSRARTVAGVLLTLALLMYMLSLWRGARGIAGRLTPIAVAMLCLALVPLNLLSNLSPLFDPAIYFAPLGGPFTASVGALTLTSSLVLLAMFVILRARLRPRTPWIPLFVVVSIVAGGPYLLRLLATGISAPPGGLTTGMWLAWEVALFLAAAALLLGAASAGSALLGERRGLSPAVGTTLAAAAALLAPLLLGADARWPGVYTGLWIAALGALALTRRHRGVVLAAAAVAALGATTVAWRADVKGRVLLANRDVAALAQERPEVSISLQRLGAELAMGAVPASDAALLRIYARSDLEGSGYPVSMATWSADSDSLASIDLAAIAVDSAALARLREEALVEGTSRVEMIPGTLGQYYALAVPFPGGLVTTAIVAPRTRLLRDSPNNALLGIAPRELGLSPYSLTLANADTAMALPGAGRWMKQSEELHGDRLIQTPRGAARAHIEIDLRSYDVLVERGTLVVLLDMSLLLGLWALSVWPEGAFRRWLKMRRQRWAQSFRLRLTLSLFAFFMMPAIVFAAWSYRQLLTGDRQSRELLVRETLRSVQPTLSSSDATSNGPVLIYRGGVLAESTEPLLETLAPIGRLLDPRVVRRLAIGSEVEAGIPQMIGPREVMFGYRVLPVGGAPDLIISTPARGGEEALDVRRRDLGVLVAFATVVGALAALWLSGGAARSLAQPIGRLRKAALAIAGGELAPTLPERPPAEFVPVFSAFRRMGHELTESREELEAAQRRTAAILRNVASGVMALDTDEVVTIANPRAEALLAGGKALPAGTPLEALGDPLAGRVREFLRGGAEEEEFDLEHESRHLHARLTRLGRGGAVLTLDDLTELARAQRVLAWGEMARQVAHEIKNPLTPIRLGVQHLRRARADARMDFDEILDRNVERILAEIDRLDEIAKGFSRYGMAPAERLPAENTDVSAVARDVVALERIGEEAAEGSGRDDVDWQLTGADEQLTAQARADELREVLINLLENSRLASARHVHVRLAALDGRIRIDIMDDGEGMAPHVLGRIFEPHFSTRTSGSGLGLAISRQIIEGWGGAIAISSEPERGTLVRIELKGAEITDEERQMDERAAQAHREEN
jgi:signal transduction histidine kinase